MVTAAIEWSCLDKDAKASLPPDLTPSLLPGVRHCCARHPNGLVCTRFPGHTGRHAAGDGDFIVAVWADPTSEAATTAGFDAAAAPAILHAEEGD